MTSILSAVTGVFRRAFFLGTLLPMIIFAILFYLFVYPLLPPDNALGKLLTITNSQLDFLAIPFLLFVLSGLLYNLNALIRRFFEGYPWRHTTLGRRQIRAHKTRIENAASTWWGLQLLLTERSSFQFAGEIDNASEVERDILAYASRLNETVNNEMSEKEFSPTRFGNVVANQRYYPFYQYNIDANALWPRLVAVIDKDYAEAMEEAKGQVDFMLNSSVLSISLALSNLIVGLSGTSRLPTFGSLLQWLLLTLFFSILAYVYYLGSVSAAVSSGAMSKSAFDLYRGKLLEQLGYRVDRSTMESERDAWRRISSQFIYGPRQRGRDGDPNPIDALLKESTSDKVALGPQIYERGVPVLGKFDLGRGLKPSAEASLCTVIVSIAKRFDSPYTYLELTDVLPEGWYYVWDSARLARSGSSIPVKVINSNPYTFVIGSLEQATDAILTYDVIIQRPQ
jgi:hypothetical protein